MSNKENTMNEIPMLPVSKTSEGKSENQIDSYEPHANFLNRELSNSTTQLNDAIELLSFQNKTLLVKDQPDVRKASEYERREARMNMETMARLMQAKINLFKVFR